MMDAIGVRSTFALPLLARGRVFGTIQLATSAPGRRYGPEDISLAQELAARAAVAIDNTRLFHEAQEAIQLREEFLTLASHELNTPLASLRLSVNALTDTPAPTPEAARSLLGVVDRQSGRLAALVAEILDLSRVQLGTLHLGVASVNLGRVVREAANAMRDQIDRARCPLQLDLQDQVLGRWNVWALDRIVTNLLSNALKFGPGKPVVVTLRSDASTATVTVRDQGIGIPPVELPRVFDRFTRAVSSSHYGGLGLGLYVARELVKELSGSISVESVPGEGSTFNVQLPCT